MWKGPYEVSAMTWVNDFQLNVKDKPKKNIGQEEEAKKPCAWYWWGTGDVMSL